MFAFPFALLYSVVVCPFPNSAESWFGSLTSNSSQRVRSIGPSSRGMTKGSNVSQ